MYSLIVWDSSGCTQAMVSCELLNTQHKVKAMKLGKHLMFIYCSYLLKFPINWKLCLGEDWVYGLPTIALPTLKTLASSKGRGSGNAGEVNHVPDACCLFSTESSSEYDKASALEISTVYRDLRKHRAVVLNSANQALMKNVGRRKRRLNR